MWDLPRPGMEPMFPVLAGGFFFYHCATREAPGCGFLTLKLQLLSVTAPLDNSLHFFFSFSTMLCGLQDLSSLTRVESGSWQ